VERVAHLVATLAQIIHVRCRCSVKMVLIKDVADRLPSVLRTLYMNRSQKVKLSRHLLLYFIHLILALVPSDRCVLLQALASDPLEGGSREG
jgi:hypothetical protein